MATEEINILPESYPMVGGDGPYSYAKHSTFSGGIVDATKGMVFAGIAEKLDLKSLGVYSSSTFQIADLGCSIGPNAFTAVQNIIETVEQKHLEAENQNHSTLEFQVFFNDHSNNDFNTLFKTLSPDRKYFASGVPGSFHNRLFPKSSLHIVHSSTALHWLSKVPKEITDSKSPAWNKGSIHCTGFVKEVATAYSAQFSNDFESFFNARAEEIVPGGLMLILIAIRPDGIPMSKNLEGIHYDFLGSCLYDLAKMGLISEEKVDSFNLPIYYPSLEEFETLIKRDANFSIERKNVFTNPLMHKAYCAEFWAGLLRAALESVFQQHFGSPHVVDQMFKYYSRELEQNISFIMEGKTHDRIELCIILKRN
ncbi:S-adenosylmethionine-dependent methyltransferase [Melia azedarach]|uniref:S-adenosylmethionine-dependent methyltransferase n=1 Tax=Melia azedarach TaxID=155640 RepID=A0ACC1X6M5_MELAZ|nr:S-adenosylmethionine-dependent methyltransferase [Melia azedarach]